MLGEHFSTTYQCNYTLIKIGENILQKPIVPLSINNFLDVHDGGDTNIYYIKLFFTNPIFVGIETPYGDKYCTKRNILMSLFLLLGSIFLVPFLGFGLLFLPSAFSSLAIDCAAAELRGKGFQPIK
ncbi:hypothetical protein [Nitrospirillum amazonense]|uniref:hypothetical protein n=1 Tax=Nitrospirillum amazonense TaxID=28077 RepID=UPI0011A4ED26|nr:hypothetical protein [Nitrospirillum amazonense]